MHACVCVVFSVSRLDKHKPKFTALPPQVRHIGRDLGLLDEFVQRHPFPGPGLAIRVICAEEPFMERDFSETQVVLKVLVDFAASVQKVRWSWIWDIISLY